ncbi:MAG: transposase [Acidobacteriota bacterium]|nr:transposase [Acidobacteriota bacterium]
MNYEYDYNHFPLAYLITLRCYGTRLHGDEKSAVDRHGYNVYGTARRDTNLKLENMMREEMKQKPFVYSDSQRKIVEEAITEVCKYRDYDLKALNVRSNHVHAVVSAQIKPELIIDSFKSYATRKLRRNFMIGNDTKVWARGRSRRYLWKPQQVALAIEYVLYGQGDIIADLNID